MAGFSNTVGGFGSQLVDALGAMGAGPYAQLLTPEQRRAVLSRELLGMGLGFLRASGPSRAPVPFGQALAGGVEGLQLGGDQATQGALVAQRASDLRRQQQQIAALDPTDPQYKGKLARILAPSDPLAAARLAAQPTLKLVPVFDPATGATTYEPQGAAVGKRVPPKARSSTGEPLVKVQLPDGTVRWLTREEAHGLQAPQTTDQVSAVLQALGLLPGGAQHPGQQAQQPAAAGAQAPAPSWWDELRGAAGDVSGQVRGLMGGSSPAPAAPPPQTPARPRNPQVDEPIHQLPPGHPLHGDRRVPRVPIPRDRLIPGQRYYDAQGRSAVWNGSRWIQPHAAGR